MAWYDFLTKPVSELTGGKFGLPPETADNNRIQFWNNFKSPQHQQGTTNTLYVKEQKPNSFNVFDTSDAVAIGGLALIGIVAVVLLKK